MRLLNAQPDPGTAGTTVTNTATITHVDQTDLNPSNNSASVRVAIVDPGGGDFGPAGVPDGSAGSIPMIVTPLDPGGTSLQISWDTVTCDNAGDHQILFGQGSQLPAGLGGVYALSGGVCNIGSSTPFVWNSVPEATDGTGLIWWVVVVNEGGDTEGSWGRDSALAERNGVVSSGECGVTAKNLTNICGQ